MGSPIRANATQMNVLPDDFRDLLVALADEKADFVVVGVYAVAFHGYARATKDLDILVSRADDNAQRVYRALASFGAPLQQFDVSADDFASYDGVLQIGTPPLRIDVLNRIDAVPFEDALTEGSSFNLDGRRIPVIGIEALLRNKQAVGRAQDLADVAALQRLTSDRQ